MKHKGDESKLLDFLKQLTTKEQSIVDIAKAIKTKAEYVPKYINKAMDAGILFDLTMGDKSVNTIWIKEESKSKLKEFICRLDKERKIRKQAKAKHKNVN